MKFKFIDSHQPILTSGIYEVLSKQVFINKDHLDLTKKLTFEIAGPQFTLDPNLIFSTYPPNNARGDFFPHLPSLVINRSTLPWERNSSDSSDAKDDSWLYLFVVHEEEVPLLKEEPIENVSLVNQNIERPKSGFPNSALCLSVPGELVAATFPSFSDLNYLSYARIQEGGAEKAVLLSNRLPKRGGTSFVYLISVENRYGDTIKQPEGTDRYIFPLLYKWSFYTQDSANYFIQKKEMIKPILGKELETVKGKLYKSTEDFLVALGCSKEDHAAKGMIEKYKAGDESFHGLLKKLKHGISNLSLKIAQNSLNDDAKNWIDAGAIPVRYQTGEVETAWYHGPLSGQLLMAEKKENDPVLRDLLPNIQEKRINEEKQLPQSAKSLLVFDSSSGVTDVSYSAAWQLGRLMVLNDTSFQAEYCKWKGQVATMIRQQELSRSSKINNIEGIHSDSGYSEMPAVVVQKFMRWRLLKDVRLPYLVPRQDMIPKESLRFFSIDHKWVNSMLCGAFSIGNTVEVDLSEFLVGSDNVDAIFLNKVVTGFILNSKIVSGWPDFQIKAIASEDRRELKLLRRDIIADNTAIFLFDGIISELEFSLHQSKMHSGVAYENNEYTKQGENVSGCIKPNGKIEIKKLANKLNSDSPSEFAKAILEITPIVRFKIER